MPVAYKPKQINRRTTILKSYTPAQVLPHRSTMLLIDRIVSWDNDHIQTTAGLIHNNLFDPGDGSVSSLICMEYLCQSAAAHAGIRQLEQGKPVTIGFIIGARKIEINEAAFQAGETFCVFVEQTFRDEGGIGIYDCALYHLDTEKYGSERIAYGNIKAVMPDNPEDVISRSNRKARYR